MVPHALGQCSTRILASCSGALQHHQSSLRCLATIIAGSLRKERLFRSLSLFALLVRFECASVLVGSRSVVSPYLERLISADVTRQRAARLAIYYNIPVSSNLIRSFITNVAGCGFQHDPHFAT